MVRKVTTLVIVAAIVLGVLCTPTFAATHNVYTEGTMSTTYVQYFKDILSGSRLTDNYVAFRSGQYEYTMVVGKLEFNNGTISLTETGKEYKYTQSGNYNSNYKYTTNEISNFSLQPNDTIIYSDVGDFPELIERTAKLETLILLTLGAFAVYVVVSRIFSHS